MKYKLLILIPLISFTAWATKQELNPKKEPVKVGLIMGLNYRIIFADALFSQTTYNLLNSPKTSNEIKEKLRSLHQIEEN
jgi:hypothetical protein